MQQVQLWLSVIFWKPAPHFSAHEQCLYFNIPKQSSCNIISSSVLFQYFIWVSNCSTLCRPGLVAIRLQRPDHWPCTLRPWWKAVCAGSLHRKKRLRALTVILNMWQARKSHATWGAGLNLWRDFSPQPLFQYCSYTSGRLKWDGFRCLIIPQPVQFQSINWEWWCDTRKEGCLSSIFVRTGKSCLFSACSATRHMMRNGSWSALFYIWHLWFRRKCRACSSCFSFNTYFSVKAVKAANSSSCEYRGSVLIVV